MFKYYTKFFWKYKISKASMQTNSNSRTKNNSGAIKECGKLTFF